MFIDKVNMWANNEFINQETTQQTYHELTARQHELVEKFF